MTTRHDRLSALLELVSREGRLSVERAVTEFGVSEATVRRDLDQLARQQLITRTRGGALSNSTSYDVPLRYKAARHASEKLRIADAAAALIRPGSIVGINGGTTTSEVARAIAGRTDLPGTATDPAATIVTNALNIANELVVRPHIKIVVTGGVVRPQSYELVSQLAISILEQLTLDIVFLGVNGLDASGAWAHDEGEAAINRVMAARGHQVVIVADSSKLGQRAFAQICAIASIDTLITDTGIAPDVHATFEDAGLAVIAA